jgi:hypothetical protein
MYIKVEPNNLIWPYTIDKLREDNPNVSFPNNPTPEDLEPFSVFIVHSTDRPQCEDPRLQIVEESTPEFSDNKWQQSWRIRNASNTEIELYDMAHQPLPNWAAFKFEFLINEKINHFVMTKLENYPLIKLSMTTWLLLDNYDNFINLWKEIKNIMIIDQNVMNEILNISKLYNLPNLFISIFEGTIAP